LGRRLAVAVLVASLIAGVAEVTVRIKDISIYEVAY